MTSEEAAFLQQLKEHPDDDTTRLVYADWLEDRGDQERGAYLRGEVALASMSLKDGRRDGLNDALRRLRAAMTQPWLLQAGKRFDVWLVGLTSSLLKPGTIKAVKQLVGCGFTEGKKLVETSPRMILPSQPLNVADFAARHLQAAGGRAEVRPAQRPLSTVPSPVGLDAMDLYQVTLKSVPPEHREEAIRVLHVELRRLSASQAAWVVDEQLPFDMGALLTRSQAEARAQRFQGIAEVEVRFAGDLM